jgi:hypothetical protein
MARLYQKPGQQIAFAGVGLSFASECPISWKQTDSKPTMSNPIQPTSRTGLDATSSVSGATDSVEVSRARQKELAAQLFKDLANADLPPSAPETTPGTTPRVYG